MPLQPLIAASLALTLGACATMDARTGRAAAVLIGADGKPAGSAAVVETAGGFRLTVVAQGLTPGLHGVHIHAIGLCERPKFASAGSHWNPASRKHGLDSPEGHHAGDMPNLRISANGRGALTELLDGATLAGLLDGDGSALVIHAGPDDQKTDPTGNSGDRLACGVFGAG